MARKSGFTFLVGMALSASSWASPTYKIVDIGTINNSTYVYGSAINNLNQVTGSVGYPFSSHAHFGSAGSLSDIGAPPGYVRGSGEDINDLGYVMGNANQPVGGGSNSEGYIWHDGIFTMLGVLQGNTSYATSINNSGIVVGQASSGGPRGFIWQSGVMSELNMLADSTAGYAYDINNLNQIVGTNFVTGLGGRGFLRQEDGSISDLGSTSGMRYMRPNAVNDLSQIVGYLEIESENADSAPFLWQNGSISLLDDVGSNWEALDINIHGRVIGHGLRDSNMYLWENGTKYRFEDLLDATGSAWSDYSMYKINDSGIVIGVAKSASTGDIHGVLAMPVPEPSTCIALTLGGIATLVRRRRKG